MNKKNTVCSKKKLVQGIGINDADYTVCVKEYYTDSNGVRKNRRVWECPFYSVWNKMLEREGTVKNLKKNNHHIKM